MLSLINATGKPNKTALAEIVTICLHILDNCTDDDLRDETKKTLCDVYAHQLHNDSLALEIADRLHSFEYCKEIVKATILTGDTAFRQAQENLILFADNIWWHTYNIAVSPDISGQNYSLDEKIDILKRAIAVFDIIFGDEPLYYHDRLANSYRQLAMFYLLKGNNNEALNCVEKMADHAIAFDNRPAEATYPSVLLNSVRHLRYPDGEGSGADEVSKCRKLLAGNFASRVWAPIRQDPRFTAAVARMKQ